MDRALLERLIGAGVLVVTLVIVVPAILDGNSGNEADREPAVSNKAGEPHRTHTIRLDRSTQRPPVAREVTGAPATAASDSGHEPQTIKSSSPAEPAPVAPEPAAKVRPKPHVAPEPAAKARPKPPVAPEPRPVEPALKTGWVVQLGSFSSRKNAQRLADEVSKRGFKTFLMPLDRSGKKLYRVRVGPRDTRAQAAELAGRLARVGYSGQVTRQQPDA